MIRISNNATQRLETGDAFAAARARYDREGYLKLAGFVDPRFLSLLLEAADAAEYYERTHEGIGVELCAAPGVLTGALELACNDPVLFTAIADLTGCSHVGCFEGRVYRLAASTGHYDSWHSDVGQDRLVAMSVNLSRDPFEGGLLQIRRADSDTVLSEVSNPVTGDAVIFKIDADYRHRVGSVTGRTPRTAWAGWFRAAPGFHKLLHSHIPGR